MFNNAILRNIAFGKQQQKLVRFCSRHIIIYFIRTTVIIAKMQMAIVLLAHDRYV